MIIVGSFYWHSREGHGGCVRACASANMQGGWAGLCSSPRQRNKLPMGRFLGKKGLFFSIKTAAGRWARMLGRPLPAAPPPCLGAEVSSVCMWHCGISDHCREARRGKKKKNRSEEKKKLKFLQEKTILLWTAVNKITAVGWFATM